MAPHRVKPARAFELAFLADGTGKRFLRDWLLHGTSHAVQTAI